MKALLPLCALLCSASLAAAPIDWLEGTVLEDCAQCQTDAFSAVRKRIANQAGAMHEPASGMGYVITVEPDGVFVWGRAALVGTGNLIRTDAHVLLTDTGQLKNPGGRVYFEPMHHRGFGNAIEIDVATVQRGGAVGPLETDVKNDWAVARLKEDAIAKFNGERVFAFLWDLRVTQDAIVAERHGRRAELVLTESHRYGIHDACGSVARDTPADYAFGVEEIFFLRCPTEHLQAGVSGSTLAILSDDGAWHLGGQLVAAGHSERMSEGARSAPPAAGQFARQLFLGNVPALRETLAIVYLQELVRRGAVDLRHR